MPKSRCRASTTLIIAYHVIARREPYHELGADYLERRQPVAIVDRLVQRLRQLGVDVTVMAEGQSAPSPTQAMPAAVVSATSAIRAALGVAAWCARGDAGGRI